MKTLTTMYLHASRDGNWDQAEELGLKEDAARMFSYALSEVKCSVEVDHDTGEVEVLSFEYNGKRYVEAK